MQRKAKQKREEKQKTKRNKEAKRNEKKGKIPPTPSTPPPSRTSQLLVLADQRGLSPGFRTTSGYLTHAQKNPTVLFQGHKHMGHYPRKIPQTPAEPHRAPSKRFLQTPLGLGARLRGRMATQCSKKGYRSEKVLERVLGKGSQKLRRSSAMGFTVGKGSEKGSQKRFWEGGFQKVPRTPPWRVRPLRCARASSGRKLFLNAFPIGGFPEGPRIEKLQSREAMLKNQAFNTELNSQSRMFFHSGPLSGRKKNKAWDCNFQARTIISNREWKFQSRMVLLCVRACFVCSSENDLFRSLGPLGYFGTKVPHFHIEISCLQALSKLFSTKCLAIDLSSHDKGCCKGSLDSVIDPTWAVPPLFLLFSEITAISVTQILDGGSSALVAGFYSRPILRPRKHYFKAFRSLKNCLD